MKILKKAVPVMKVNVTIDGEFENKAIENAVVAALESEGIDFDCEVEVVIASEDEIRSLNNETRGIDKVTDVLSFPQFYDLEEEIPEVGEICLGDVVICKDKAAEQAEEFGHSFEREIIYLFVHSVLHLLGYDHMEEDEKACMRAREEEIMEHLGVLR
jgi:probable rRNA maturation factor